MLQTLTKSTENYECTMCNAHFVVWMFFFGIHFWFYLMRLGMENTMSEWHSFGLITVHFLLFLLVFYLLFLCSVLLMCFVWIYKARLWDNRARQGGMSWSWHLGANSDFCFNCRNLGSFALDWICLVSIM